MEDVSEKLLSEIKRDFNRQLKDDRGIAKLYEKVRSGKGTYDDAYKFAHKVGGMLKDSVLKYVSNDTLPNETMYVNITEKVLGPMLQNNHELITEVTESVQLAANQNAGIGIKAIKPKFDSERVKTLAYRLNAAETFDNVREMTGMAIENIAHQTVLDSIKENFIFQSKAGLNTTVTRVAESTACKWCKGVAGVYSYDPNGMDGWDLWKGHDGCKCRLYMDSDKGRKQLQLIGHSFQG